MRLTFAASVFALAVLAVACGGGGKSGMLPSSPGQPSAPSGPVGAMSRLTITLKIPPAAQQSNTRKPFYFSPNTQSIVFAVVPQGQGTPTPSEEQLFQITATPSPCTTSPPNGAQLCTFNVQAPFGTDIFYVATFGVATPTAASLPLASLASGPIVVASPGAGSTPSPITLVMKGVVASVKLTVGATASTTQVFTVSTASTPEALGITPYDASNNPILTDTFDGAITINVTPANSGVGFEFTPTCPSPSPGGGASARRRAGLVTSPTVNITCAADLGNVQYVYDGSVTQDATAHITDTFTISSTQFVSPAPSPATIVLASTIRTTQITSGAIAGGTYSPASMQLLSDGTYLIAYEYDLLPWIGIYNPTTQAVTTPVTLTGGPAALNGPSSVAVANGTLWVESYFGGLYCYSSVANALAGQAPVLSGVVPTIPALSNDPIAVEGIATDVSGNLWYVGNDSTLGSPPVYAGFLSTASGCVASSPTAPVNLSGMVNDSDSYVTALPGGGIAVQNAGYLAYSPNAVYVIKNTAQTTVSPIDAVLSSANAGGLTSDGAGNIYAAYYNTTSGDADIETMPQTAAALSVLAPLPPPVTATLPSPVPIAVAAFGPNGGAADRVAYADAGFYGLGLVEGVPASPMPLFANLPNQYRALATTYGTDGTEYALYEDSVSNLYVAHLLVTRAWSVASVQITNYCNESTWPALVSLLERGDSGPFTFTSSNGSVTVTQIPGIDHDYFLTTLPATSGTFNVTVADSQGRTQTIPITSTFSTNYCGIARRQPRPPH